MIKNKIAVIYYKLNNLVKYKKWDMFKGLEIETNSVCNRKCSFCPNYYYKREKGLMDERLFKKIIMELAEIKFNGKIAPHFYGEPLLDKRLSRLMRFAKEKLPRCRIQINTNGDLLTKEKFDLLVNNGVDKFLITQYDKEMPENIKLLFRNLSKKDKKRIVYRRYEDIGLMNRGGLLNIKNKKIKKCTLPSDGVVIDFKGKVILCCNDYFSKYVFGDLNKEKLMEIWNKDNFKKIRKELRQGIFKLDICKKCVDNL